MRIKSMVLEGFKSYGKRIEINGFDKEFNAITGFNGTGKSNILDAICFVLGITNLGQVRATSLQDLVYKSGQAGIKKASVTITFDNRDRDSSPHGYDNYEEITITRQIIIGKNMMNKNNYMINGSNVPNKKVHDMFCSVQLNVNNPHFLIMQGRITKVLNMRPIEILSMIEEAAGTSMYENKKQTSLRLIEKKDNKLKEITNILREEIGPKLTKLKEERSQYVEFQKVERELEHSRKIQLAWNYVTALSNSEQAKKSVQNLQLNIDEKTNSIAAGEKEIQDIDQKCDKINKERNAEESAKLKSLENNLQEVENSQFKLKAEINGNKETIKAAQTAVAQLKANISEDDSVLLTKQTAYEKFGAYFQKLKEADEQDSKAVLLAQEVYQKISSGLLQSEDGENATLEQQLINVKQTAVQAQTEYQQCEMKLKHSKAQITKMQTDMQSTENEYKKNHEDLQNKEKELKNLENELNKLDYKEGYIEELQQEKFTLLNKIRVLTETVDQFESKYPQTRFEYFTPNNFQKGSVKGLVCKLINIKDKSAAYALEIAAGAKLFNVIVDTETTGKRLLQEGKLRQRVTIIPLNKVEGRSLDERTVNCAQNLVGADNAVPALSLIDFPAELKGAMTWIFGDIFICKDMEAATEVAYHRNIMKKCVTLQGDVFDPFGALSGGATPKGGSVLLQLQDIKGTQNELSQVEHSLQNIESIIRKTSMTAEKFLSLKQTYELRSYEINLVKQRLQQTTHHKIKEEIESLRTNISELTQKITEAKKLERDNIKRATELESQLKDASTIHDRQLKDAENKLKILREKAEASRKEWQSREQESETLELEINELKKGIETGNEQLIKAEEKLIALTEKEQLLQQDLHETEIKVSSLQSSVKEQREKINQQNKHIQKLLMRKDDIIKQNGETQLDIKKFNLEMKSTKSFAISCEQKILDLTRKYEWIEQEKIYFGKAGGIYDFNAMKPEELSEKVQHLETVCKQLSRNVNTRAINLLDKEEERYTEVLKKKKIVENDKRKIIETIQHLDQKKKETLLKAWEQVNKDFSSIFSSLLPGADAKLQPVENQEVTDGLEVKIGFSGVWKESLGELSGGQRSLVALSLILAMLLFKPAPLYILDEVDAALDLSHTENIGTMLKRHFKHSQFIVVSLKDGMFNNANVLFTTKFLDGMSTITRLEKVRNK